ncbi:MAG: SpoIIE family protein phosphatase [Candidatus Riflebacteria bacterium]|nr:SpoIIE family protein phosphatase [Candidatus Riflebacteria bacterium]
MAGFGMMGKIMNHPISKTGIETLEFPRLRWAVFCLVFWAIPLLLRCYSANVGWAEAEEKDKIRFEKRLDRVVSGLAIWNETPAFITTLLRTAESRIFLSPDPWKTAERVKRQLNKRFPGLFTFSFLDPSGNIIGNLTDGVSKVALLKRFNADYRARLKGDYEPIKRSWRMYQSFIGALIDATFSPSTLIMASYRKEKAYTFVGSPFPRGMVIVRVQEPPDWKILGIRDQVKLANARNKHSKVGLIGPAGDLLIQSSDLQDAGGDLNPVLAEFESGVTDRVWRGNRIWVQHTVAADFRLIGVLRMPPNRIADSGRLGLVASMTLLFAIFSISTLLVMKGRFILYLPIRLKLVLLFLYTAGLPLSLLSLTAGIYISDRRQVLESSIHREREKALFVFDRTFLKMQGRVQSDLNMCFRRLRPKPDRVASEAIMLLEKLFLKYHPSLSRMYDEAGHDIWKGTQDRNEVKSARGLRDLTLNIFKSIRSEEENVSESLANSPLSTVSAVAGGMEIEALFAQLVLNLGRLAEFSLGDVKSLAGVFPIFDSNETVRYLVAMVWGRINLERQYVVKHLDRASRGLSYTSLFAFNRMTKGWHWPPKFRYQSDIQSFLKKVDSQSTTSTDRVERTDGKTLLLTGIRGSELSEYDLIAVTSDAGIQRELSDLNWMFRAMIFLMLLISATVGTLLARKFLAPVGYLAEGVDAIKNRRFDLRLPVLDRDELGDLAATFNDMMGGLADLEIARIVQESLFPNKALSSDNLSVYGNCRPAAQVGGDYFDYFTMPNGKTAVLVGDVSGHGVAAAMGMAMAKAVIASPEQARDDPARMLSSLHSVLLTTLKRKKMMTFFYGVVEAGARRLVYSNAGHCYPYLVRAGRAEALILPGFPLGSISRSEYVSAECPLEPGDVLIFFTDGLVEAFISAGEMISYARFEKALPGLIGSNPMATEAAIESWFDSVVAPGPLDDDITVVALHIS